MKKSVKVWGFVVIFVVVGSIFGGVVTAEDVSGNLMKSGAEAESIDKNYNNFNSVNGIDVSHWQGNIDWSKVYNLGYRFAFAKATEGVGFTDSNFEKNMNEAHATGMLIGAYHFARPDLGNDAANEARYFVSVARKYLKDGYLRPALDLEEGASLGKVALSNWVHEWMNTVKSETGVEPIIYVNSNYASNFLDSSVTKYDLWIAHWRCDTGTPPNAGIWDNWDFWQYYSPNYCGENTVPGISGGVDLDIFNGDMSRLHTFVITGGLIPLTADLTANGTDTPGIYNTSTAEFTFDGKTVRFGLTTDIPIIGDWDGDGYDEIGVFRPKVEGFDQSTFYLVTRNWADLPYEVGAADKTIPFGYYPDDIPVAGDWDGDDDDDIGGYYPANSTFYLYLLNLCSSTATSFKEVPFGLSGDTPITGDWDWDGDDDVGVYRAYDPDYWNNPTFYFDLNLTGSQADITPYPYGNNGDIPVAGSWNGDGDSNIGVYRPGTQKFFFAYNIPPTLKYLDNGIIKVGVNLDWGGAISEISHQGFNLIDDHDAGRLAQVAFYDNSSAWNPVQGGDIKDKGSPVLDYTAQPNLIYTKTQPRNWNTGELADVYVEQWVSLEGEAVKVDYRMTHWGTDAHTFHDQEFPCAYVNKSLYRCITYNGSKPWTNDTVVELSIPQQSPGSANTYFYPTEYWASFVNDHDFGLTLYSKDHTAKWAVNRFDINTQLGYLATVDEFSIEPGMVAEVTEYYIVANYPDARSKVYSLEQKPAATDVNIQGSTWLWVPEKIVPAGGAGYYDYYPVYSVNADTGTFMMDTPFNSISYIEKYFDLPSNSSSLSLTVWGARNINGWCGDPVTVTVSLIDSNNITHQLGCFVPVQLDGGVGQGETKKFNISNFAGQNVKIRIKQTSSGEHCTYGYYRDINTQTTPVIPTATDVNIQGSIWRWVPEKIVPAGGPGYCDYYPVYSVNADTGTFIMDTPFSSISYIEKYFDLPSDGSSLSLTLTVWGARNINGWCGDPVTVTVSLIDSSNNTHQLGSFIPVQLDGGVGQGETKKFNLSNFAGQNVKIRIKQTSSGEHCTYGYYRDINIQTLIALGKPVTVTTNGADEPHDHVGEWPSDITDGSLDYQPVSSGIEDGCVAWVNDDYNELMVVTVTIDLQGTYNINKIRYNMGNCQRAETWNADIMESPFGRTPTNPGTPYSGAWTEQTGDITASNVTIKFEKTRTAWERDWLFIGEIEVWGTPVETSEFEFIHLTDVHIGKPNMVEIFSRTINEINILKDNPNTKLRFILLTGDFVENNSNSRREVEAETYYKEFDDLLKSLDPSIPVYIVPGNHERYTHEWFGDDNLESYHKYIKYPPDASILIEKDNYTFNYGGYLLIGLDSGTVTDESGISSGLTDDQLNEMENLNKDLPKIIFMHVPAINIPSEKGVIGNNRERFINYCKLNNAQIVLTGHTHRDMVLTPDGYQVDVHSSIRPLFIQTRSVDCTNRNIPGFRQIKANNTGVFPYWSNVLYTSPPSIKAFVESPVDLHAYDSQGRHTGVNYTNTERNIPQSFYIRYSGDTPQTIILYNTSDNYSFEIVSNFTTQQQMKSLEVESFNFTVEQRTTDYLTTIHYYNVSITQNTTAILPINLTTTNYTMLVDTDGDGETDETKDPDSIEINYAPTATIVSPENGSIYNESETIEFNGTGTDPEDGVLANSSLLWTSDIDGVIGVGNRFSTTNLSVGTHTVTLMVNDSGGLTDIQSITLTVNEIASPKTIYVDFFVTGDSSGNVYVFPSYGNGSFADKELIGNIESGCLGSAIADFDNDGDLDLTIQSKWGDSYLFINDGTGGFAQTKVAEGLALSEYSGEFTTADFNNDGYYDYVVSSSGAYIYLFTNNKNNTFSKSTINAEWLVTGSGLNFLSGIDTGDFNEDGNMDFLIAEYREYGTDLVYLYIGNGDGTFTYKFAFDNIDYKGGDTRAVVAGDFDNDGHCDAIVGQDDDGEPGQTWLYKGDGTGNFTYFGEAYDTNPSIESGGEYSGAGYADAYDFDGDGNLDVVASAHPYGGGDSGTFFFKGNGNGTFRALIKVDEFIGTGISAPPLKVKHGILVFDIGEGTYPSISGTHNGTITPSQTIPVNKLYTYPCSGTGGHAEYARIYNDSWGIETLPWEGYGGDWYNLSFTEPFKLYADEEYKFTIITGSYPQIHHNTSLLTPNGRINCTKFTDANGRIYYDWIPAIRLWSR